MSGQRYSVTIDIGANISSVKNAAQQLKTIFDDVGLGAGQSSRVSNMFKDLDKALADVQKKSSTALTSIGEARSLDKAKDRVTTIISNINDEFAKMGKLGNTELTKNFSDLSGKINEATKAIRTYNTSLTEINKGHNAAKTSSTQVNRALEEQTRYFEQLENIRKKFQGKTDAEIEAALKQRQSNAKGLETRRQNELENFVKQHGGRINTDKTVDKGWLKSFESKASQQDKDTLDKLVTAAQSASTAFKTAQENYTNFSNALQNFKGQENFDKLTKDAQEAANALKKFEGNALNDAAFNKLKSTLEQIFGPEVTAGIQNSSNAVNEFQERINQVSADKLEEFRKKVPEINNLLNQMGVTGQDMGKKIKTGMDSLGYAKEAASEMDLLSSRLKYFFSLAGGFNLMRRAIRSAVTTTKELDAVMTQTAVVSNYTVKDMWKTLPQYSKEAKKLGVAIKDVYSAQTLYVQQGLDMNSAMDIGVETMKMARVANIGAEEATNSMTAALRGFNMELNETSAKRINDVYSKLAQNTASNTQEISTAMTKTAALANSANMSFENTAAFLATIIESTREGAETAGTALKTVIARFTEVKQLYKKGELTGTDEEGQVVDVNKISKALRTAGINMNDFFTGAKGLDEIFKELGSKWSSLTTVQQRYIATMAAGSRQQSRFLALMQNYDRTIQLTEMAYNSAGSGEEQFSKTLDSLEAKINQFKAAWDTFIMGIANSDLIKGFIDSGTQVLNIINKITDVLSGGNGLVKSVLSLGLAFGTFKGLGTIFKGMMGGFLTSLTGRGGGGAQPGFFLDRWGKALKQRGANLATAFKKNEITGRRALNPFENFGIRRKKVFGEQGDQSIIDLKKEVAARKETYEASQKKLQKLQDQDAESWAESVGRGKDTGYYNNSRFDREQREKDYQRAVGKQQEEVDKNQQKLKESETNLTTANQGVTDTLMAQASAMQSVGVAAGMLAGIFGALSSAMESKGNYKASAWLNGAAKGLGALAASLTVCGTAFMAFGQAAAAGSAAAQAALSAIPIIGWAAAAVSAIVAVVSILNNLDQISEKQKEEISQAFESNQTELKDLKNSYDNINDSLEKIDEKQTALQNMTAGTTTWKNAVQELNGEIEKLLEDFPDLMEAITFDEQGNMTVDVTKAKEINDRRKGIIKNREVAGIGFQNALVDNSKASEKEIRQFEESWNALTNTNIVNKLSKASEEGKLNYLPINDIIEWSDYDSPKTIAASPVFKQLKTYLMGQAELTEAEFSELFNENDINGFLDGLKSLRYLYERDVTPYLNQKEIKKNTLLYNSKLVDEKFTGYSGIFKNWLSSQAGEEYLRGYNEWQSRDKSDDYYISQYAKAMGYIQSGESWYNTDGEKIDKISADVAKKWAQSNAAFDVVEKYLNGVLDGINEIDPTLQNLLKGKGKYGEYASKDFAEALKTILPNEKVSRLIADFTGSFVDFEKLAADLGYSTENLQWVNNLDANSANQIVSIISKLRLDKGKETAGKVFSKLSYLFQTSGLSNEDASDVLQKIASGELNNYDDLTSYLSHKKNYKSTFSANGKTYNTAYQLHSLFDAFQQNKSYKDWADTFSDEWEFYNSIKSSNGAFSEEDITKLVSTKQVSRSDFGLGGHYIKGTTDDLAKIYKDYLQSEITKTQDALKVGKESAEQFIEKTKNKPAEIKNQDIWTKFLKGELDGIKEADLMGIAEAIWGKEGTLYNAQAGTAVKLSEISGKDISSFLESYLSMDFEEWGIELLDLEKKLNLVEDDFDDLSVDLQNKITDIVHEASKTRTSKFTNNLLNALIGGKATIKPDSEGKYTYESLLSGNTLEELNWNNIESIDDFVTALKELNYTFDQNAEGAKELFDALKLLYKTSKMITADQVTQIAQFGAQLKTKIKSTGNGNYTKEEVDYILAQNKDLANQFVQDIEQGGYTYIGNVQDLENAANVALTKNSFDQLEARYQLSQLSGVDKIGEAQEEYLNTLFGHSKDLSQEEKNLIEQWQSQKDVIETQYNLVKDMEPYVSMTNDQARMAGASPEIQQAIALQDAQKAGFNTQTLVDYAQKMQETTDLTTELAYAIAYDAMLMNKGVEDLKANFSSLEESLISLREKEASLWTATDIENVNKLKDIVKELTGVTGDLNSEILLTEDTLQLLKRIAAGDVKAVDELSAALSKAFVESEAKKAAKEFQSNFGLLEKAMEGVDFTAAKVGDHLDEGIQNSINGLLEMGAISQDTASQLFELMGYEPPEFEPIPIDYEANTPDVHFEDIEGTGETTGSITSTVQGQGLLEGQTGYASGTTEGEITSSVPVLTGGSGGGSTRSHIKSGSHAVKKAGSKGINPSKGGGGGGGGKKEFKNDFDKYYNQVQDINELERQRNLLEKDYEQLLKAENLTGKDIYDNLKAQIGLLKQRKFLVEDLADKRLQQLFETMQDEDYKDVAKYAWWNEEDKTIEIDWDSIDEVKDAEEGNLIKEYVKKLEDFQSKYDEQIEQLEEIDDAVQEIKERGKDQYNSLEERVRDALIKQIQDKIDELTEVEEAVNDTNQKLFDSISETLELQRQERDNAKTEEELTDKEKRLAYLQQDSANANALEIAQLQEELADARESYTDTLIDQKISELQRQNEEAAEQRQQQIDLMQRSLDYQEKNGVFWNQVYEYINDGVTAIGDLIPGSDLVKLLQGGEAWESLSSEGQMQWLKKLEEEVSQAIGYLALSRQLEDIGTKQGTKITFTNAYDQTLTGTVDKNGNVVVTNADGSTTTYKDVYQSYDGTYHTMETVGEAKAAVKPTTSSKPGATKTPPTSTTTYKVTVGDDGKATVEEVDGYSGDYVSDKTAQKAADEMNSWKMEKVQVKSDDGNLTLVAQPVKVDPGEGKVNTFIDQKVKLYNKGPATMKFATGGLADFTGPAWLDGTKSKPELVLNARDTQNFIELKDVLADMKKNGGASFGGGDNYYNINVNVDQMSSDYDVDRAIDRIKTRLAQDGAYRNVNTLSRLR